MLVPGCVAVFVGPTLASSDLRAFSDFVCLPPASCGDVYRASSCRPRAIGLIDGYFDQLRAVWHKEVLWALSHGVQVFGSASMGALRAAELADFGMRGVGRIFESYRSGAVEDDDEVAVLHGPAESGFLPLTEPMVNIRATLAQAVAAGVIGDDERLRLQSIGKAIYYQDRTWPELFARSRAAGLSDTTTRLEARLGACLFDEKRKDALEMLGCMRRFLNSAPEPAPASFRFEWTDTWDELVRSVEAGC